MKITIIVPSLILLKEIFKQYPPKEVGLDEEKLLYIVNFVFIHQIRNHESSYNENDEFPTVCMRYLRKTHWDQAKPSVEYLLEHQILILKGKHFAGETCRRFSLNPIYMKDPSFYTIKGFTFTRAINKLRKVKKQEDKFEKLASWLKKIEYDVEGATVFNNLLFEARKKHTPFQTISKRNRRKPNDPQSQYVSGQLSIMRFETKDSSYMIDNKGMRLHTSMTNSPRLLRNYISINGEYLVSIDIKNSQPFMLLGILNPCNFRARRSTGPTSPSSHPWIPTADLAASNLPSIIVRFSSEIQSSIEFQEYKKMVTEGTIYDVFINEIQIEQSELDAGFTPRDVVKFRFMLCFYSPNKTYSGGMKTAFRMKFPKIYRLINELKMTHHNTLALLLQRVESILVLDKICGRIIHEKPNVPLFTIHDSILTTPDHVDYVQSVMREVFEQYIGVAPKMSVEYCKPAINKRKLEEMDRQLESHQMSQ
jgi:hypothetical protein